MINRTLIFIKFATGKAHFIFFMLGFIVMASLTLVVLYFYPKAYNIIFILYGLGCAAATSQLIFNPLFTTMIPKLGESWVEEFNKPVVCGCNGFSVTSHLFAYIWTVVWIWYGITHHRPETNAFFWITLNILGACLCIMIVSVMKLNSIKIATILLVGIFFYDIFFVFITPFLTGGISVMLQVASGSENPNGADFCYKYPEDRFCKGIGFLPMLFILPKANDYADGSVILGLGDIIRKCSTPCSRAVFAFNYSNERSITPESHIIIYNSAGFSYCF